ALRRHGAGLDARQGGVGLGLGGGVGVEVDADRRGGASGSFEAGGVTGGALGPDGGHLRELGRGGGGALVAGGVSATTFVIASLSTGGEGEGREQEGEEGGPKGARVLHGGADDASDARAAQAMRKWREEVGERGGA